MNEIEQDVLAMRKGKLIRIRYGEEMPVDLVVTLSNGARVGIDGSVTLADGTSYRLMDGDVITMDGEMTTLADAQRGDNDVASGSEPRS